MNPLLSFWIKVQPLSNSLGTHTWKAISQSSAVASSSGDDATVQRTTASCTSWLAFDYLNSLASRVTRMATASWLLNPMISRMQDATYPIIRPSSRALCEGMQRYPTRKKVDAPHRRLTRTKSGAPSSSSSHSSGPTTTTSLQQSQTILQHQDYANYRIMPPHPIRRNSKEWVREYKKERIDKINYNNVFGGASDAANNDIPTLPPPPPVASNNDDARARSSSESSGDDHSASATRGWLRPASPTTNVVSPDGVPSSSSLSPTPSAPVSRTISSSSSSEHKTTFSALSPHDVICGRGGKANTHPGNISFREEAKKLRSWYESSSKSEKFGVSSFLVDVVRERGGRFLKRDPEGKGNGNGGWLEADGGEVRKKASQALREGRRSQ